MKLKNFELKSQKCLKIGGSIIGYNVWAVGEVADLIEQNYQFTKHLIKWQKL